MGEKFKNTENERKLKGRFLVVTIFFKGSRHETADVQNRNRIKFLFKDLKLSVWSRVSVKRQRIEFFGYLPKSKS